MDERIDLGARQLGKARQQALDSHRPPIQPALQHHSAAAAIAQHPCAHLMQIEYAFHAAMRPQQWQLAAAAVPVNRCPSHESSRTHTLELTTRISRHLSTLSTLTHVYLHAPNAGDARRQRRARRQQLPLRGGRRFRCRLRFRGGGGAAVVPAAVAAAAVAAPAAPRVCAAIPLQHNRTTS